MNRIKHVDGLRALAVLSVVIYHSAELSPHAAFRGFADLLVRQGCHGVELFFVVSGFCLSYPAIARLHERSAATFDVARFAAHRIARIVPPYYFALGLSVVFAVLMQRWHVPFSAAVVAGSTSAFDVIKQALFADAQTRFVNTAFWTLPVELRWYVVFPFALLLWNRSPRAFFAAIGLAVLAFFTRAGTVDFLALPAFMLGIVAAHAYVNGHRLARYAALALVPVTAAVFAQTPATEWGFVSPFSELAAFLFVVAAGSSPLLTRALSSRALAFVGVASYSIYLVHAPLMGWLETLGAPPAAAIAAGLIAGIAFWWLVERPLTSPAVREKMVEQLAFIGRWLSQAGVPSDVQLRTARRATVPETFAPPSADAFAPTVSRA